MIFLITKMEKNNSKKHYEEKKPKKVNDEKHYYPQLQPISHTGKYNRVVVYSVDYDDYYPECENVSEDDSFYCDCVDNLLDSCASEEEREHAYGMMKDAYSDDE